MKILILLLCLLLSGCGFHPVYGVNKYQSTGIENHLVSIQIANIPDREGQTLKNALIDRFHKSGSPINPRYKLNVSPISESIIKLDITETADSTRAQMRQSVSFNLHDQTTNQDILKRNITSIVSYNILSSEFSTRVSEDNARMNGVEDLAGQIEQQLALYFKRN